MAHEPTSGHTPPDWWPEDGPRWLPPSTEQLTEMLPQYTRWELLGMGGMGAVFKAWQTSLDRWVAVKVLPPDMGDGRPHSEYVARFKNEARTIARLSHPCIVLVYDSGETPDGQLYFVMEFVDGTDVAKLLLQQGRLPPEQALEITTRVSDALLYAHAEGVIHRDVKPANVLIGKDGKIKVVDFGLAKLNDNIRTSQLTRSRMMMGTMDFVAPETYTPGVIVDFRADLYSVGVMFYNMLTGEIPRGLFKLPSQKVGTDRRLDQIISKCLETDPKDRYQNAAELRKDLGKIKPAALAIKSPGPDSGKGWSTLILPRALAQLTSHLPPGTKEATPRDYAVFAATLVLVAGGVLFTYFKMRPPAVAPTQGGSVEVSSNSGDSRPKFLLGATKEKPFINSLGQEFVPVPGTEVLFCRWETRVKDYRQFAEATQRTWPAPSFAQAEDHPAVGVSWFDATLFCDWLSRKEGKLYRLPTDREWSFAMGIGDREPVEGTPASKVPMLAELFPWGRSWPIPANSGNYADEAALRIARLPERQIYRGYEDGFPYTSPVGRFPANPLGIHDLSGNVWEWCADFVDSREERRVLRGGSYESFYPDSLWCSHRGSNAPVVRRETYGFRIVLTGDPVPSATASPAAPANAASSQMPLPPESPRVHVNGSEYQFIPGRLTWGEARARAIQMGGHLAVITTPEEQKAVKSILGGALANGADMAWIGATRVASPQGWQWVTGEPMDYADWDPANPSSTKVGDWLAIIRGNNGIQWNDFESAETPLTGPDERIVRWTKGFVVEWRADEKDLNALEPTSAAVATRLNGLEQKFLGTFVSGVSGKYATALKTLTAGYINDAIVKGIEISRQHGLQEDLQRFEIEKTRMENGGIIPDQESEGTPELLKGMRAQYREALRGLQDTRRQDADRVFQGYLQELDALVEEVRAQNSPSDLQHVQAARNLVALRKAGYAAGGE